MLTHADDVGFGYEPRMHGQGWLVVRRAGTTLRLKPMTRLEYRGIRRWAEQAPQRLGTVDQRVYWMFQGRYFSDGEGLTQRQVHALLRTHLAG